MMMMMMDFNNNICSSIDGKEKVDASYRVARAIFECDENDSTTTMMELHK